jgi:hypothetical protein
VCIGVLVSHSRAMTDGDRTAEQYNAMAESYAAEAEGNSKVCRSTSPFGADLSARHDRGDRLCWVSYRAPG